MGRGQQPRPPLETIWEVSDDLWDLIEPILHEHDPAKPRGRTRIAPRAAFDTIIFRLRTGCQWNHLPSEYPDDSSVHRTFRRWVRLGIFERIWATIQERSEELGGCDWEWQAADGAMTKARGVPAGAGPGARLVRTPLTAPIQA